MLSRVTYEVTLDADPGIAAEFDAWLTLHVRDMLKLPGFLDAKILHPQTDMPSPAAPVRRVVQYTLVSQADLDNYFHKHAERMRAEGTGRFGEQLHASRRVLDIHGEELAGIQARTPATVANTSVALRCLNCSALLTGYFCANCGQQNHSYAAPLWGVINDFFGNHFGFDTKFFHSILPLLFRPGFLSREYSAGRRVRYINPLRLYFFSSLLFFFIAWSLTNVQFMTINVPGLSVKGNHTLTQTPRQKIQNNLHLSEAQKKLIINSVQNTVQGKPPSDAAGDNNVKFNLFGRQVNIRKTEFTARITHAIEVSLPKLMFVFLPLVALLLNLFYIRSKHYYMEHLVFTLHNHAFVFVAMLCMVLANILAKHAAWAVSPAHFFNVVVGWYIAIYIFLAMRFYYRQSFFKTLIKYLLLGFIYWVVMTITFVTGMIVIFAEVVTT